LSHSAWSATEVFVISFGKNIPQLIIPDKSSLRKSYVIKVYDKSADKVKSDLSAAKTINLIFDGWTDGHHAVHYLGLRAQLINDDWCRMVVKLSLKPRAGDSNSVSYHICKELLQFIPDYGDKELFSTHDGAAAMKKREETSQGNRLHSFHCACVASSTHD
jgi:hypothetical protein